MPITKVVYSKLYNLGNYQNERFEAEVTVGPDQTPEQAMTEAKTFVEAQRQAGVDAEQRAWEARRPAQATVQELPDPDDEDDDRRPSDDDDDD